MGDLVSDTREVAFMGRLWGERLPRQLQKGALSAAEIRDDGPQVGAEDPLRVLGPLPPEVEEEVVEQSAKAPDGGVGGGVGHVDHERFPEGGKRFVSLRIDDRRDDGVRGSLFWHGYASPSSAAVSFASSVSIRWAIFATSAAWRAANRDSRSS